MLFIKRLKVLLIIMFKIFPILFKMLLIMLMHDYGFAENDALKPIIAEDPYKLLKKDIFRNLSIYLTHTNRVRSIESTVFFSQSIFAW